VDVLSHLTSEDAWRAPAGKPAEKLLRLAGHVLEQRSLYPLFPPSQPAEAPLDLGQVRLCARL
jgi:DNA polymerase alpha subunit B